METPRTEGSDIGPAGDPPPEQGNPLATVVGVVLGLGVMFVVIGGLVVLGWVNSLHGHNL